MNTKILTLLSLATIMSFGAMASAVSVSSGSLNDGFTINAGTSDTKNTLTFNTQNATLTISGTTPSEMQAYTEVKQADNITGSILKFGSGHTMKVAATAPTLAATENIWALTPLTFGASIATGIALKDSDNIALTVGSSGTADDYIIPYTFDSSTGELTSEITNPTDFPTTINATIWNTETGANDSLKTVDLTTVSTTGGGALNDLFPTVQLEEFTLTPTNAETAASTTDATQELAAALVTPSDLTLTIADVSNSTSNFKSKPILSGSLAGVAGDIEITGHATLSKTDGVVGASGDTTQLRVCSGGSLAITQPTTLNKRLVIGYVQPAG